MTIKTHQLNDCIGPHCCIHNPSDHHMRDWPLHHRVDRWPMISERICPHGVGHPDPDSLEFVDLWHGTDPDDDGITLRDVASVHGCDGCCRESDE